MANDCRVLPFRPRLQSSILVQNAEEMGVWREAVCAMINALAAAKTVNPRSRTAEVVAAADQAVLEHRLRGDSLVEVATR